MQFIFALFLYFKIQSFASILFGVSPYAEELKSK